MVTEISPAGNGRETSQVERHKEVDSNDPTISCCLGDAGVPKQTENMELSVALQRPPGKEM